MNFSDNKCIALMLFKIFNLIFALVYYFRELVELGHSGRDSGKQLFANTDSRTAIAFPPPVTAQWEEQVF